MEPHRFVASCNLLSTDTVADFGAGSGFISRALAQAVPQGSVFAIEINKDIIARLNREKNELHQTNIHPIWGDIERLGGSKLQQSSVDVVVLSNVLFHIEDKDACFKEIVRVLKPGGKLVIADWSESFGGMGPQPHMVVSKDTTLALAKRFGFLILNETLPAGEHHYGILFKNTNT